MLQGIMILLLFQFVGEVLSLAAHLPVPGNVLGFIMLLIALLTGMVKLEHVEEAANLLLDHLALIFIPPGVGIMQYFGLIRQEWIPITVSIIISTLLVLLATAKTTQALQGKDGE